jgi:DNA-binding PadR family transcriptional regulator
MYRDMLSRPYTTLRLLIRRGTARLLVLHVLSSQPMHGYRVAKDISAMFDGTYVPSAGVIYPTLQWLEDQGYVKGARVNERTNYAISDSGKRYLKRNEESLKEIISFIQGRREGSEFPILQSAARLQRTIASNLAQMSKENKIKVAGVLDDANAKVSKLLKQ